jgi:hypothetical protein
MNSHRDNAIVGALAEVIYRERRKKNQKIFQDTPRVGNKVSPQTYSSDFLLSVTEKKGNL